jgi:hypothetical protein
MIAVAAFLPAAVALPAVVPPPLAARTAIVAAPVYRLHNCPLAQPIGGVRGWCGTDAAEQDQRKNNMTHSFVASFHTAVNEGGKAEACQNDGENWPMRPDHAV